MCDILSCKCDLQTLIRREIYTQTCQHASSAACLLGDTAELAAVVDVNVTTRCNFLSPSLPRKWCLLDTSRSSAMQLAMEHLPCPACLPSMHESSPQGVKGRSSNQSSTHGKYSPQILIDPPTHAPTTGKKVMAYELPNRHVQLYALGMRGSPPRLSSHA